MSEVLVAVPVLARPRNVGPLVASLEGARGDASYRAVFLLSPGDRAERRAVVASGADFLEVPWQPGPADWARKIGHAVAESDEPWMFTAADDLLFGHGWADEALRVARETGARYIGTCDGGNNPRVRRGLHSTHSMVARSYIEERGTIDEPGQLFHYGYDHSFADDEAVETAKARGEWAFAADACVKHLHPYFGTAGEDATYLKGRRNAVADQRLFNARRRLWARG